MKRATIFIVFLVCASSLLAALQEDEIVLFSSTNSSGRDVEYRVPKSRLRGIKPWSPDSTAPPLAISAAVAIARKSVKVSRPKDLILTTIQLAPSPAAEGFWFYTIEFYDSARLYDPRPPDTQQVVILMDGSIVTPRPRTTH